MRGSAVYPNEVCLTASSGFSPASIFAEMSRSLLFLASWLLFHAGT